MNALRNSVRLIGHIGEDPKVKKFEGGKTVANFTIATNEIYRDSKGEKQSETTWHRLVAPLCPAGAWRPPCRRSRCRASAR